MGTSRIRQFAAAALIVSALACAQAPPKTAGEAAAALQKAGLSYEETQQLPKPAGRHVRFDEAIALSADNLWVEIIRIEDERTFKLAGSAAALLALAEAHVGREFPGNPEVYTRQPFVFIVREEPEPGMVLEKLNAVFPERSQP